MPELPIYKDSVTITLPIDDYLSEWEKKFPRDDQPLSPVEFYAFKDESLPNDETNLERVWLHYDSQEKEDHQDAYDSGVLPYIKEGTTVKLPSTKVQLDLEKISRTGQFLSQGNFEAFWSAKYEQLLSSVEFSPDDNDAIDESGFNVKVIPQSIRVWIYIRALDKILDFSSFVTDASTNKTAQTGGFAISFVPTRNQDSAIGYGNGYFDNFNITTKEGYSIKSLLEKFITQNDIVFLRFEKLKLEKDPELTGTDTQLEVSPSRLINSNSNYNVWDMIGLIDTCNVISDAQGTNSQVDITGSDFTKLFIEDGSYFIPLKWVEGSKDRWFYGGSESDSWFQRNVITGNYDYLFHYGFRSIRETLWFIINILSNISIVPDSLFSAYQDKRTTAYSIDDNGTSKNQEVKGIWQIVKVFVEETLDDRAVVDHSFANPDGTLMSFILKICQEPFVEVLFDTYTDTLDIVVRQPPFTEKAILDIVESASYIEVTAANTFQTSLSYDQRVYSWYQLFPQNNYAGMNEYTSLAFIPIIYFDEFVEIWGNKKQQLQDIYLSLSAFNGVEGTNQLNSFGAALLNDLLYVVETNVYLPFTRRGTIIINGDRRVKVGTFIKLNATDELFYVTAVAHQLSFTNQSIERVTVLQVERGMYFPILAGLKDDDRQDNTEDGVLTVSGGQPASYFKIADIDKIKKDILEAEKSVQNKDNHKINSGGSGINAAQFDYFINRKMYGED